MRILLLIFLSFICYQGFSQDFQWGFAYEGSYNENFYDALVDDNGDIYVTGSFKGTVDVDPGPGDSILTSSDYSFFLIKYSNVGDFLWAKTISGNYGVGGYKMVFDSGGNIVISGAFVGTVDFDPGPGIQMMSAGTNNSDYYNIYVLKLTSSGDFIWSQNIGSVGIKESMRGLTIDSNDNIYLTGFFEDSADFDPGPDTTMLVNVNDSFNDAFFLKLDSFGNLVWAKSIGGNADEEGWGIAVDSIGSVYVTGKFEDSTDFDPGSAVEKRYGDNYESFILKLDSSGIFEWVQTTLTVGDAGEGKGILVGEDNFIYSIANTGGTVVIDTGVTDIILEPHMVGGDNFIIQKMNSEGTVEWVYLIGSFDALGPQPYEYGTSIEYMNASIYITGSYEGFVDFDVGPDTYNLYGTSVYYDNQDVFILKMNTSGDFEWVRNFVGSGNDGINGAVASNEDEVFAYGVHKQWTDFNPDLMEDSIFTYASSGWGNPYLVKLGTCDTSLVPATIDSISISQVNGCPGTLVDIIVYGQLNDALSWTLYKYGCNDSLMNTSSFGNFSLNNIDTNSYIISAYHECLQNPCQKINYEYFPNTYDSLNVGVCSSYTVPSGDETYTISGIYYDTLVNANGCDSLLYIDLIVGNLISEIYIEECYLYTVPSGDETYLDSGVYLDTIPSVFSCDSVIKIHLSINNTDATIQETSCFSYTVPSGDETYFTTGIVYDTIQNLIGCDSVITIDLTIGNESYNSIVTSSCNTYTVPSGDETYYTSGVYNDTIVNFLGCDSIIDIDLTIFNPTQSNISVTECYSYTVPSGDETYFNSGIYQDTISNMNGCDSVIVLDLTILNPTQSNISVTECYSYTVPSGDETYFNSGTYQDTISNINGCDSVIIMDLTILDPTQSNISVTDCYSYTVPSGIETYYNSGIYQDTISNTNGCDSVIYIDLTIVNSTSSSIIETACDSFELNGQFYDTSGIYQQILVNEVGCDSVIELELTIIESPVIIILQQDTGLYSNLAGLTYQWVDCNNSLGVIIGENSQYYYPVVNGSYAVIGSNGACVDTSECFEINNLFIIENSFESQIIIYPNPTKGLIVIEFNHLFGFIEIVLSDNEGKEIRRDEFENIYSIEYEIESSNGDYFLTILDSENHVAVIKIIKL